MCEPATIVATVSAVSTVMQGYAARQQGKYEEGVAKYNARNAENQATRTRNKGTEEENKHRRKVAELVSQQKAQAAANGIEVNSGSPLDLQEDTLSLGEADALTIRRNFSDEADALDSKAELLRDQGKAARSAGNAAFTSSLLSAGGSFLSSGVADSWFKPDSAAVAGFTGTQGVNTANSFAAFA